MHRDPLLQYLSIQRARLSEQRGRPGAWHCFGGESCTERTTSATPLEVDVNDAAFYIEEQVRLEKLARRFKPVVSRSFEECVADASRCVEAIYGELGLPRRPLGITPPRVSTTAGSVHNRAAVDAMVRDVWAGNWTPVGAAEMLWHAGQRRPLGGSQHLHGVNVKRPDRVLGSTRALPSGPFVMGASRREARVANDKSRREGDGMAAAPAPRPWQPLHAGAPSSSVTERAPRGGSAAVVPLSTTALTRGSNSVSKSLSNAAASPDASTRPRNRTTRRFWRDAPSWGSSGRRWMPPSNVLMPRELIMSGWPPKHSAEHRPRFGARQYRRLAKAAEVAVG